MLTRGYLEEEQKESFRNDFLQKTQDLVAEIPLNFIGFEQNKVIQEHIQRQMEVGQSVVIRSDALCVYIQNFKKITNFDMLKRYLNTFDQVFIFCDTSTIKQIKNRMDKLLVEFDKNTHKRIDLFTFNNLYINLYLNSHSPLYTVATLQEIKFITDQLQITKKGLPKIQINDPLLMYYGFNKNTIIKQHSISEITSGEMVEYLRVISSDSASIYLSFVLTNF